MYYMLVLYMIRCYHVVLVSFFFFKQKTAYEMRISDWSSDVCSSDLHERRPAAFCAGRLPPSGTSDRCPRPTGSDQPPGCHLSQPPERSVFCPGDRKSVV